MAEKAMIAKPGYSRRSFLKIIGAGAGMAATGCGRDLPEKFIPYVVQPDEVIPGVAAWYSGTCTDCSAGCGTLARVREGRVVKLEGNPANPINRGGLCALGQSSLQALYDPDRIRLPLKRETNGAFTGVTWTDAIAAAADAVAACATPADKGGSDGVIITRRLSASELQVVTDFRERLPGLQHIEYTTSEADLIDVAAEQVFGPGMRTNFNFAPAKVVVSFGADYLGTWLSPVEYGAQWAANRRPDERGKISKVVHFEPRLSLTAGNADHWIMNQPGSDRYLLLALLKTLVDSTGGVNIPAESLAGVAQLVASVDRKALAQRSGVSIELIDTLAAELAKAPASLVVAGGANGEDALSNAVLANLVNVVLGNVGKTVILSRSTKPAASGYEQLTTLLRDLNGKKKKLGVMMLVGVNPAFTLPPTAKFRESLSQAGTVIALATALDETASAANIVLPLSHQLESWGDSEPRAGVFALNQPAMSPLYSTQTLGDTLISLAANSKLSKSFDKFAPFDKIASFYDYIRAQWKKRTGENNFEQRWLKYVEQGGELAVPAPSLPLGALAQSAVQVNSMVAPQSDQLTLLVYPSVTSRDGASANRPWMQELPNPTTSAVWGSWVEMHPDLAQKLGVETGDAVQVVTPHGYVGAPAYVTKFIAPGLVAVPIGQGHESYGRYAVGIGANAFRALDAKEGARFAGFTASATDVRPREDDNDTLVMLQGSDSQHRRGIIRSILASQLVVLTEQNGRKLMASGHAGPSESGGHEAAHGEGAHGGAHGESGHGEESHGEGHGDPLALGPRPLPKQMYRQSEHPLYRWGMSIDLSSCTGCSACVVACYAENNISVVGKTICNEGREMSWIRIERYLDGPSHQPVDGFAPMMCQHCANAPCEPVCPVYATYHTDEGLNSMVYNRCVGTRYCLNNCSYKVRRFNWFRYNFAEPLNWQLNPDVTVREVGVMEKCTFCIQRIREGTNKAKDLGRPVRDGDIQPACASSCPTNAIQFGNLLDAESRVAKDHQSPRSYKVLDFELNTQPAVAYLARVKNHPVGV